MRVVQGLSLAVWAVLCVLVAYPANAQQLDSIMEVRVGAFHLERQVDFITDSVSFSWARTGDPIPSLLAILRGTERPSYKTLELRCSKGELKVLLRYSGGRTSDGVTYRRTDEPLEQPSPQTTPVQFRFDSDAPLPPQEWRLRGNGQSAEMPSNLVPDFVALAEGASRLRARMKTVIPELPQLGPTVDQDFDLSLEGFSRAVELLGCGP